MLTKIIKTAQAIWIFLAPSITGLKTLISSLKTIWSKNDVK